MHSESDKSLKKICSSTEYSVMFLIHFCLGLIVNNTAFYRHFHWSPKCICNSKMFGISMYTLSGWDQMGISIRENSHFQQFLVWICLCHAHLWSLGVLHNSSSSFKIDLFKNRWLTIWWQLSRDYKHAWQGSHSALSTLTANSYLLLLDTILHPGTNTKINVTTNNVDSELPIRQWPK